MVLRSPLCLFYLHRAQYWCFKLVLPAFPPGATCILQPQCPQPLNTSLIQERGEFSFYADSPFWRGKKERKKNLNAIQAFWSPTLERQRPLCLPGTGHQCFYCIFLLILNFGNHVFSCGKHTHFIYTVLCLSLSHIPKLRLVCVPERMHESK